MVAKEPAALGLSEVLRNEENCSQAKQSAEALMKAIAAFPIKRFLVGIFLTGTAIVLPKSLSGFSS